MHLRAATALLLTTLAIATPAAAEVRANLEVGTIGGIANDVRAAGGTSTLSSTRVTDGFLLRAGAAGRFAEAGVTASFTASSGPSALAIGVFAGPSLAIVPRLRFALAGEVGVQVHSGFGNEFGFLDDAQSSDVTLPYVGATASLWLNRRSTGTSLLSFGLYAEARFELGHETTEATVTPSSLCLGVLECLLTEAYPPMPFTQSYDVGGRSIYFGLLVRFNPAATRAKQPSSTDHRR